MVLKRSGTNPALEVKSCYKKEYLGPEQIS